jgi:hypothetical protein
MNPGFTGRQSILHNNRRRNRLLIVAGGVASGILLVVLVGGWTIWRSNRNTPHHRVLLHIPDTWLLITVTRPSGLKHAGQHIDEQLKELLDDPLDSPFPAEADNLDEAFDVQFAGGEHVRFWTFVDPPAKENIVGQASLAGEIRGVATWKHSLGRLAMPDPRVVVASPSADGLETAVLEGTVRMRPVASPATGDFVMQINLDGPNAEFTKMRTQLSALSGGEAGEISGLRQLSLAFHFTEPAAIDIEFVAASRAGAAELKRQHDAGKTTRKEKLDRLVAAGVVQPDTPEHRAFLAATDAPARIEGDRVMVSIRLPAKSLAELARFAVLATDQAPAQPTSQVAAAVDDTAKAATVTEKPLPAVPPTKTRDLDDCLAALAGGDRLRQMDAARYLSDHPPEAARRAEVMYGLLDALKRSDRHADEFLARPLRSLAADEDVPALIEALQADSLALRRASLEVLGKFPSEQTAAVVADVLARERSLRTTARESLEQMGAPAEPAVRELLTQPDRSARIEACRILTVIGTRESIPALTMALDDRHLARHARDAIAAIENRGAR